MFETSESLEKIPGEGPGAQIPVGVLRALRATTF